MPQRLKQQELQDKRTNENTGLEEVQDYSEVTPLWDKFL